MVQPRESCFAIGIAARMVNVHPQTLRHYERLGLLSPERTLSRKSEKLGRRLYSAQDIERATHIRRLIDDLGVNLAGVEVVLSLHETLERVRSEMEQEMERTRQEYELEIRRLKDALARVTGQQYDSNQ